MGGSPPSRLGRYEIVREVGRGAMGVVYLARDPLIGRMVALKTFRLSYATDDDELGRLRSRFLREAQSAGILSQHPGIVTIHDVAPGGDGTPAFIAMEYVEGTDLKELIKRQGALDPSAVADLVRGIGSALDYAHAKGVVHRDVKPANVILTSDRGIRITDFGIARLDAFEVSNLTLDGQMLGTPNYMAPEQVMGSEVDHRADIFSLGVIAYELLTGKKPFLGENLTAVTHKIVHGEHPPPSSLVPGLPRQVDAVIARCLEKSPSKRWPRAGDFAAAFDQAVGSEPVRATAAPPPAAAPIPGAAAAPASSVAAVDTAPTVVRSPDALLRSAAPASGSMASDSMASGSMAPGSASAAAPSAAPSPAATAGPGWAERAAALAGPLGARLAAGARRAGPRRLALVGAVTLVVGLAAATALMAIPRRLAPPPSPSVDLAPQVQFVRLMREGQELLAAGDPAAAALAFRRAERLTAEPLRVRALREEAEAAAAAARGETGVLELAFGDGGEEVPEAVPAPAGPGGSAATAPREPSAGRSASAPAPGPDRPDLRRSRLLEGAAAAPPESAPARTTPPGAPPASAPPAGGGVSALVVDLASEVSVGSVVVSAGGRRVISRTFEFFEKGGRFSRKKPSGGELILGPAQVPAGDLELQVWVAVGDQPAKLSNLTARFPRGGQRRLVVRIASPDEVSLRLE